MWQRIQTVYLILAIIVCLICAMMPVANTIPEDLAANSVVYNLCTVPPEGGSGDFTICHALALAFLLAACTDGVIAIFTFKKRKAQANFCLSGMIATILWIADWCVYGYSGLFEFTGTFKPTVTACLPIVAMILFFLARKAILKDEALVRSMDRIR